MTGLSQYNSNKKNTSWFRFGLKIPEVILGIQDNKD